MSTETPDALQWADPDCKPRDVAQAQVERFGIYTIEASGWVTLSQLRNRRKSLTFGPFRQIAVGKAKSIDSAKAMAQRDFDERMSARAVRALQG